MGSTSEYSLRFDGSTLIAGQSSLDSEPGAWLLFLTLLEKCYRIPANKILVKADPVKQITT